MPVEYRVLKTSRAIDCHTHVFSASAPAVAGARYRPAYAAKLESLPDQTSLAAQMLHRNIEIATGLKPFRAAH